MYSALFAESGYRREGDSDSDGAGRGERPAEKPEATAEPGGTAAGIQIKHKFFKRQGGMNDDAALLFAYSALLSTALTQTAKCCMLSRL